MSKFTNSAEAAAVISRALNNAPKGSRKKLEDALKHSSVDEFSLKIRETVKTMAWIALNNKKKGKYNDYSN